MHILQIRSHIVVDFELLGLSEMVQEFTFFILLQFYGLEMLRIKVAYPRMT